MGGHKLIFTREEKKAHRSKGCTCTSPASLIASVDKVDVKLKHMENASTVSKFLTSCICLSRKNFANWSTMKTNTGKTAMKALWVFADKRG